MSNTEQEKPMSLVDLKILEKKMEEMANTPKEDLGKRQSGELSTYEKTRKN